jgi:hypothetical protein
LPRATVSELDNAIMYVFQAKNHDYWFGSNDRGAYRYDGNTLVNFTTTDGWLAIRSGESRKTGREPSTSRRMQASARSTGKAFTTLNVSPTSAATDWALRPDDLWFVGHPIPAWFFASTAHRCIA